MVEMLLPFGQSRQTPTRIILHAMGEFVDDGKTVLPAWDFLQKIGLSAHSLITPSGVNIRQRKDEQGAYHAKGFNNDSLGIEFLVPGIHDYDSLLATMETDYLTNAAYSGGLSQVREWLNTHKIKNIETHSQLDPKRKYDPGSGFPLQQFFEDLQH